MRGKRDMSDILNIEPDWLDIGEGVTADPTACMLEIQAGQLQICRAENRWSRTVVRRVPLSAEPLAAWMAASWWRLRWEPLPARAEPSLAWRMSHDFGAAGGGFLWPDVRVVSDGETIELQARPSAQNTPEMLGYLTSGKARVNSLSFEAAIDVFMSTTLSRLGAFDAPRGLESLWTEVQAERRDPHKAAFRRIEALLGHDPGEAPDGLVERILLDAGQIGETTLIEIAALAAEYSLPRVLAVAEESGLDGSLAAMEPLRLAEVSGPPHAQGRVRALRFRRIHSIGDTAPIDDADLVGFLGLDAASFVAPPRHDGLPMSLALPQRGSPTQIKLVLRRNHPTSRRFDAARALGDILTWPGEPWHPVADLNTARQKQQRAFASELLAPIAGIENYLNGDFSADAISGVAEYYGVSERLIGSQLANQGVLPRGHLSIS